MSAEPDLRELNAFVDGELDLVRHLEIEGRMRSSAALRARVEALRRLQASVRAHGDRHVAPAALRAGFSVAAASTSRQGTRLRADRARAALGRWFAWRPMASALALVLVAAVGVDVATSDRRQDDRLRVDVIAAHARATMSGRLVDVASSDHHTVKPYLSARLDFSPPVRELAVPGSVFLGGRVDQLDGHPVAALVYRQGKHVVDAFVWPTKEADSAVRMSSERGFHLARWSQGGMAHCVISDVSPDVFAAIAQELRSAPASSGSD